MPERFPEASEDLSPNCAAAKAASLLVQGETIGRLIRDIDSQVEDIFSRVDQGDLLLPQARYYNPNDPDREIRSRFAYKKPGQPEPIKGYRLTKEIPSDEDTKPGVVLDFNARSVLVYAHEQTGEGSSARAQSLDSFLEGRSPAFCFHVTNHVEEQLDGFMKRRQPDTLPSEYPVSH